MKHRLTLEQYKSLNYKVVIEHHQDDDVESYSAYIAELGRFACYGTGDTVDEALAMLTEVKKDLLEYYYENDVTIPLPEEEEYDYSGKFVVRTGPQLHKKLVERARSENQSLNSFVVAALWNVVGATSVCAATPDILYEKYPPRGAPRTKHGGNSNKYPEAA